MSAIDLHIHSCYSEDGDYSPSALVQMCSDAGIRLMAIADHNTVAGVEEAIKKAERLHMRCYPAIEIDCCYEGVNFHVLGYEVNHKSADFHAIEENVRKQCVRASKERLNLINKLGFSVTERDLIEITANTYWSEYWTGDVFAEVLLDRLIPLGLDGLEAFSSYHDAETTRWFYNKALEKGISVTHGSDFHGKNKPSIKLGQYSCI